MVEVKLLKGFTQDPKQGNPAGIVTDYEAFSKRDMQGIAAEIGFSVTVFIEKSGENSFDIRFFTPTEEDLVCGHGTIAAFHTLLDEGQISLNDNEVVEAVQNTGAGELNIECYEDGKIVMEQNKPCTVDYSHDKEKIAELLGIERNTLMDLPIETIDTGKPKIMIPVKSLDALFDIEPDLEGIEEYCKKSSSKGFYPFTFETKDGGDVHARQFNPIQGIGEDPITGTAAGPLGAYLRKHDLIEKDSFVVEQGYIMDQAGKIYVDISGEKVKVGGYAVEYDKREI